LNIILIERCFLNYFIYERNVYPPPKKNKKNHPIKIFHVLRSPELKRSVCKTDQERRVPINEWKLLHCTPEKLLEEAAKYYIFVSKVNTFSF
jgi:hypothetical protein